MAGVESPSLIVGPIEGPILHLPSGSFPMAATVRVYVTDDRVVTLRLRVRDGRPTLVGLTFGTHPGAPQFEDVLEQSAPEVTAAEVREFPVERMVRTAVRAVSLAVSGSVPAPYRYGGAQAAEGATPHSRRRRGTDRTLRDVAAIVRSYPTTSPAEVRRQLQCSERTAYRWIAEARKRGLTAPTNREERP